MPKAESTDKPRHIQQAEGLESLARMVRERPDLAEHMAYSFELINAFSNDPAVLAEFLKAGKRYGATTFKDGLGDDWFVAVLKWGPVELHINANREQVCEARQVGTKTVKQKDPAKLAEVPEVEVEVPVYEWDCKPLLGGAK
jgi:hypothetical protein